MFTESRLLHYEQPQTTEFHENANCRQELRSLQQNVEQSVNTLRFEDKPQDTQIQIDPHKPVILHIAGIDTVFRTTDTSAKVDGLYTITRDVTDPSRIRIQVRPNALPTANDKSTQEKEEAAARLAEFRKLKAEHEQGLTESQEEKNIHQATIEQNADGTRTLRVPEGWQKLEVRVQSYPNPMILKPASIAVGDLNTNGFRIEKDPKNANAFIIKGKLNIEATAS